MATIPARVFLLYTYEEHGPEGLISTLDMSRLPEMLRTFSAADEATHKARQEELQHALNDCKNDSSYRYELENGWGGVCLEISLLE